MHRSDRRRSISADIPIIGFDRRSQMAFSQRPIRWRNICENYQTFQLPRIATETMRPARAAECRGPRGDPHAPSGVPVPRVGSTQPTLTCLSPYRLMLTVNTFDREHARDLSGNIRFCKVSGKNHGETTSVYQNKMSTNHTLIYKSKQLTDFVSL